MLLAAHTSNHPARWLSGATKSFPASAADRFGIRAGRSAGFGRQGAQLVERPGGVTTGVGAIHHHVVPTGIRSVEPVSVNVQLADQRMTHVVDSQAVANLRTGPQLAESCTHRGQFSNKLLHASIAGTRT